MTAVEKIILEIDNELQTLESLHGSEIMGRKIGLAFAKRIAEQAKVMEEQGKVEFAFKAYSEMLSTGKSFVDIVNSMITFKSE